MPLIDILTPLAVQTGLRLDNANSKQKAIDIVNEGARRLYESTDMQFCLYEQVFDFDLTNELVTLPYYVDIVRGIRCQSSNMPLTLIDKRPRYQYGKYYQDALDIRVKQKVALNRDLENESPFTFTISAQNDEAFTVTVVGSTSSRDRVEETLSFSATDVTKTTVNSFLNHPPLRGIYKNKRTKYNVVVTDASANEIAEIASHRKESKYLMVQIRDPSLTGSGSKCYEILYKYVYEPFDTDYSDFVCPGFDDAILHMALSVFYMASKDQEEMVKAVAEEGVAKKIARNINKDSERSNEHRLQTKPSGLMTAHNRITR
jgi:hypothetical protein|tara:strand:- start:3759 stop:4709 length:951 start_codon:yes stop_codon:yes gene_type:complete